MKKTDGNEQKMKVNCNLNVVNPNDFKLLFAIDKTCQTAIETHVS